MKMKKLSEGHYIVVDDSEIKEGDFVYSSDGAIFKRHIDNPCQTIFPISKVTRSTEPLDKSLFFTNRVWGCERLSLGEVKELLGEVDVHKKALAFTKEIGGTHEHGLSYIDGYNQAIEDNKEKKYTEKDMQWALHEARYHQQHTIEEIIEALHQPQTEWEVEIVDGILKLKK